MTATGKIIIVLGALLLLKKAKGSAGQSDCDEQFEPAIIWDNMPGMQTWNDVRFWLEKNTGIGVSVIWKMSDSEVKAVYQYIDLVKDNLQNDCSYKNFVQKVRAILDKYGVDY